jgi:hypothetical protein
MHFNDLEKRLKKFFLNQKNGIDSSQKARIKMEVFDSFENKQKNLQRGWGRLFSQKISLTAFALSSVFVFFNFFPFGDNYLHAGKIMPKFGPVEIIRDGKTLLVDEEMILEVGDFVKIGNSAEAEILFPDKFSAIAKKQTQFRVVDEDSLFLEVGEIDKKTIKNGEISTNRGFVRSTSGAQFRVSVSESGETKVVNSKNKITVFDWNEGSSDLKAGEEIQLRTDTLLTKDNEKPPNDLSLSISQIMAIRSKLLIARTKLLTGSEKSIDGDKYAAGKDFSSADKTFRSIVQILSSGRNLKIAKRKNLEAIRLNEVFIRLMAKTEDVKLLTETKALETLFEIIRENKSKIAFGKEKSGVTAFDRFLLIERIFALGTPTQQKLAYVLKERYAISFLRKIQNESLKIDQISVLNEEIKKLPKTGLVQEFLEMTKDLLAPDLAEILQEKIEYIF